MPDQLTLQHFDDAMRAIAETLTVHSDRFDQIDDRFDRIDATLADHTQRLEPLEKPLDLEHRFERFESETREKLRKVGQHLAIFELTV